jgi:hypothetical protein
MNGNINGLDEMQTARNSKIGSQMFSVLSVALLANIVLYGLGIRWLDYPTDVMVIVVVCLGIYLVRTIMAGACPHTHIKMKKFAIIMVADAAALAFALALILRETPAIAAESADTNYAVIILMGVSIAALAASGIASIVRKRRDKRTEDDSEI